MQEGKKCKQRMTVALFVNAAGEKKTPSYLEVRESMMF